MNENQKDKAEQVQATAVKTENADTNVKKASFGSLTPLTTAQIITLLVGTTKSNSSYGGY